MVRFRILLLGAAIWMLTPPAEASFTAQRESPQPSGEVLQIGDYLQRVSAEGVRRRIAGVQILKP